MMRTSWVLFVLALLVLALAVAGAAGAQDEERRVTVEFTGTPLVEVLRVLFRETTHAFSLDPGLEDIRVTASLRNATFTEALRDLLSRHGLAYTTQDDRYHVMRRSAIQSPFRRSLSSPIIIYSRVLPEKESTQIVWREFSANPRSYRVPSEEHVLYTFPGRTWGLPIELGCLPSPDGSCLLIWRLKGSLLPRNQTTRWLAVGLRDGAVTELGETPGLPWLSALSPVPYWEYYEGRYRLVLIPDRCAFTADLGTLSGSLPGPETPVPKASERGPLGEAWDRLAAYCERHHAAEEEHLRAAFAKLTDELEAGHLGFDDPGTGPSFLLLSLGIPSTRSIGREGWAIPMREAACSPDGKLIAYADRWQHETLPSPEGRPTTGHGWGARLDVFEVATGRRLWYARQASVPRWVPEAFRTAQHSTRWTTPRFADLRWSPDGRYLSFTTCDTSYNASEVASTVTVLDVARWSPLLTVPDASNAFVISPPAAEGLPGEE